MQTVVVQDEQLSGTASPKSRLSSLIEQHPLASFFVLAYAISWILWIPLVASGGGSPTGLGFFCCSWDPWCLLRWRSCS